jgi:hypothetical protein
MTVGDSNVTNLVADVVDATTLKIGSVALTATPAEINAALDGILATYAELNAAADQTAQPNDGIHPLQVAIATFDPTGVAGMRTAAAHGLGVSLPAHALVVGGFVDVNTHFHSAADTATVAISVEGGDDIIAAAAVSGAPWSTINRKAIVPKANTPESTSVKTTAAREITATVAVQALTEGKATVYLYFICGKPSA